MADEKVTAPDAAAIPEAHASDNIPVQTSSPEPLIVAKEGAAVAEPASEPVAAETPAAEAETAGEGEGQRKTPPKLPEWAQKKIADAAFEAREATRKAKALEEELAAIRAPKAPAVAAPTAADTAAAQAAAPAGGYKSDADFNAAVQAEANRRAADARAQQDAADFDAACNAAYAKGKGDFGNDFDAAAENLRSVGAMNRDMLDLVLATDDPAKVLFELGSDPDKAASILSLPPAKRAVEIAKLSVIPAPKKEPTPLSRAPRPVETVEGSAKFTAEPSDDDDDAAWFKKREAEVRARRSA